MADYSIEYLEMAILLLFLIVVGVYMENGRNSPVPDRLIEVLYDNPDILNKNYYYILDIFGSDMKFYFSRSQNCWVRDGTDRVDYFTTSDPFKNENIELDGKMYTLYVCNIQYAKKLN